MSALLLSPLYYSLKQLQAFENVTVLLSTLQGLPISRRKEPSPGTPHLTQEGAKSRGSPSHAGGSQVLAMASQPTDPS